MARLSVRLHGEDIANIELQEGREYIAGRANDADIQLADERGISRHHLKFYQRDNVWIAESLSNFVQLQMGSETLGAIELQESCNFSLPPYEFKFELVAEALTVKSERTQTNPKSENLPDFYRPKAVARDSASSYEHTYVANNEATVAGLSVSLVPYLRISFPNTTENLVLKLEGHLWVAGRNPISEIPIDSGHVSRKHFELARTQEGFYITDLGSRNGTSINGISIPPHEPKKVESGDEITIKNIVLEFEIRDTSFSNRLDLLPVPQVEQHYDYVPEIWNPETGNSEPTIIRHHPVALGPATIRDFRLHHLKQPEIRKRAIRYAIIALIPLILIGVLMPSSEPGGRRGPNSHDAGNVNSDFDKLTNEQRSAVKDSFNLARNLYVQGKYALCLTELTKVHELAPIYENSKELEALCLQGRELRKKEDDNNRKERERQMIEEQISSIVDSCKAKLGSNSSVDETRLCLSSAMELAPEHNSILEMIHAAQANEDEQALRAKQREQNRRKAASVTAQFERAQSYFKKGDVKKALLEYERFVNTPAAEHDKNYETAKRDIAAIKTDLKAKVELMIDKCKELSANKSYRKAFSACTEVQSLEPDNQFAKDEQARIKSELRNIMKNIYQDSVLEESLGNVDSAKEKWKRIVQEDIDTGEYHLKAKSKLQKYGMD